MLYIICRNVLNNKFSMICTYIQPQSRNELKNKFGGKTVLKDVAYSVYKFAVIESLVVF